VYVATHQQASTGEVVEDNKKATPKVDASQQIKMVNGQPVMKVKVYAPLKSYYDGDAFSISAVNDTGPFDILPRHHNFMTLLNPCDIIVVGVDGQRKIRINRGVMHVKADRVVVFLDV
jgi:F0F1-type ATP synthase epsilon subunit